MGPIVFVDLVAGSDMSLDSGEQCSGYRVNFVRSGHLEATYRGSSLSAGPGTVAVYQPEGLAVARWAAGSRMLGIKIDSRAVDDALRDALGRQVTRQPDFANTMPTEAALTQSWVSMVLTFAHQLFRPDSLLNQPMVGLPVVDGIVHGFLLAADHAHREALIEDPRLVAPHAIRTAVDIIEAEAQLPWTLSSIAARCHVSVRSLQQGFERHLGISPMAYLRQVRLRRAHQTLVESDPSEVTVASVAHRWGFTHLSRFAAAHAERYGESPSETLHRNTFAR